MKNCLILGSGRSGSSMVAGCLSQAGYYMGDDLLNPSQWNPKGFFEDGEINRINEDILARCAPRRPPLLGKWFFRNIPLHNQRWLARLPVGTAVSAPERIASRIEPLVARAPYAFKDPRFSYSLPAWRPFVKEAVFICIFRHPSNTCRSIQKMIHEDKAARRTLSLTKEEIFEVWYHMHRHILDVHRHEGSWLFLHYNEMLCARGADKLEAFLQAPVDRKFPDKKLNHALPDGDAPKECMDLYEKLCQLAEYKEKRVSCTPRQMA